MCGHILRLYPLNHSPSIGLILMATVPPINRFLKWPLIIGPAIYPADATWLPGGKDCLRRRLSSPNGHMRQWAIERSDVVLPPVVFYCAGMEWLNPSQSRLICFSWLLLWFWMDNSVSLCGLIMIDPLIPMCVFWKRLKLLSTNMCNSYLTLCDVFRDWPFAMCIDVPRDWWYVKNHTVCNSNMPCLFMEYLYKRIFLSQFRPSIRSNWLF